jgi:hypothetical protein
MSNNLPEKSENSQVQKSTSNGSNLWAARNTALNPLYYNARITRKNPGSIIILLDQSGSMDDEYKEGKTKAEVVADVVNDLLNDIVFKCQREGSVRDYFQIMIIGYGQETEEFEYVPKICWEGALATYDWVKVSDLKGNELDSIISKNQEIMPWGEVIESSTTKKIWIQPIAEGLTPMKAAFELCLEKIEDWICDNINSFPPLIFNITDGFPSDVDDLNELTEVCDKIKNISTNHGNSLLFNCLFTSEGEMLRFPFLSQSLDFEEAYHKILFECSSIMPSKMKQKAYEKYGNKDFLNETPVGVIINADVRSVTDLLNIGTNTLVDNVE